MRDEAMRAPLPTLPKPELALPAELYPEYPEDWLELTEEYQRDYLLPTHAANVPSRTTYPLTEKQATSTRTRKTSRVCGKQHMDGIA